jgi:hypothetical protein
MLFIPTPPQEKREITMHQEVIDYTTIKLILKIIMPI